MRLKEMLEKSEYKLNHPYQYQGRHIADMKSYDRRFRTGSGFNLAFAITRKQADMLPNDVIFRVPTRGPDTTGFQGWFMKADTSKYNEHDKISDLIKKISNEMPMVNFSSATEINEKPVKWFKVLSWNNEQEKMPTYKGQPLF